MATGNRISHALLLLGQTGSGTLPLALAFAQYINCENPLPDDSCGTCRTCLQYQKLTHPDLHFALPVNSNEDIKKPVTDNFIAQWREAFITNPYLSINDWYQAIGIEKKQGIIGVDESMAIVHKLFLKSFDAHYKVLIIWHADKMNASAANKLLKIIEEPPDNTVFILITERYENMLPTILSRTQLIKVPLTDTDTLVQYVREQYALELNKAKNLVHLAANSLTAIRELAQQESATGEMEQLFMDWMRMCWSMGKDYKKLLTWIDGITALTRDGQKNFLLFALDTARECLITNMAGHQHSRFDESNYAGFERFSKMIKPENVEPFSKALEEASYHIERNANAKILFLDLSFKMHRILRM
jgi:DNA polymerase-3 subunit delta'